ncbi:MAG: hypothetical protein WDW36_004015 [Sanguina aurantia]
MDEEEDAAEIRSAFKKLALIWHPDKNNGSEESTAKFKLINTAYMRLTKDRGDDMEDYNAEDMYDDDLFSEFVNAEAFFML